LNATGDQWPHSFGSVRLPVTGKAGGNQTNPFHQST
jgi:hypothetical protein